VPHLRSETRSELNLQQSLLHGSPEAKKAGELEVQQVKENHHYLSATYIPSVP